jgi:hypothetical protein
MQAVVRLGPSRTTLFFNLLPLITALIAAVVLHEQLALYHLVGGLLTLGGVILSERWTTVLGRARLKSPQGSRSKARSAAFNRAACSTNNRIGSASCPPPQG